MSDKTLGRLMSKIDDPDYILKQTKYENARLAVKMGWELAVKIKFEDMKDLAVTAGWISSQIEKDFNSTIAILDTEEIGNKSKSS